MRHDHILVHPFTCPNLGSYDGSGLSVVVAMTDDLDALKPMVKLRRTLRSTTVHTNPEATVQEPKRRFSFFKRDSSGKRKRSPLPFHAKEKTMGSQQSGEPDVAAAFSSALASSASLREQYDHERESYLEVERRHAWDAAARASASEAERRAAEIVWKIREHERENLFGNKASEAIPGPETLDMGGQFLTNLHRIEHQSLLFKIAHQIPKGAHLHIHFNSEFSPRLLLKQAERRVMDTLFVRTTTPLLKREDLATTEIVFNVLPTDTDQADVFSSGYLPEFKKEGSKPWMKWARFKGGLLSQPEFGFAGPGEVEDWVVNKIVLSEGEVYDVRQTTNGIWARFNQGTRAFKGLLGYESIYRWYVGHCIDSMRREHVMYAELRPMLLDKSIPSDDGTRRLDNEAQMTIINEEYTKKRKELEAEGKLDEFPFGMKIIYCTPRSIPKELMKREMQDCIKLKLKFPKLICGFDLVGAEDRANHIGFYRDELLGFQRACADLGLDIPFMFHAGESLLDRGGSRNNANSNLYDSVALHAKRIGHGYALVKHPELADEFRKRKICIELCPTSNELLRLCRNIKEHPYPELLALGIPCCVNSDNPSFFRGAAEYSSSVSHEFYQVMVGSTTMNLHGWRQLAEWSLEYSCLDANEQREGLSIFRRKWEQACEWVVSEYGPHADSLDIPLR